MKAFVAALLNYTKFVQIHNQQSLLLQPPWKKDENII